MADENNGFPKIHIDFVANGDFVHLRTDSGQDMKDVVEGFEENAAEIFKGIGTIKQVSLASGVFSGNATNQSAPTASPASSPPPSAASTPPGQGMTCDRCGGATKDLRGRRTAKGEPYKNRYYCKNFNCKGPGWGEWIE